MSVGSLSPLEPPARKPCATLPIREMRSYAPAVDRLVASASLPDPVFGGVVHMLNPTYSFPAGTYQMPMPSANLVLAYLQIINGPALAYTRPYAAEISARVKQVATAPTPPIPCAGATVPGGPRTYTDAVLAAWLDTIGPTWGIPPGDMAVLLNPPAFQRIVNTDAPLAEGVGGYHGITPGGRVYAFANVNNVGVNFTLSDIFQQYAQTVSHELQEAFVNPTAGPNNPEVCDPCAGNCLAEVCEFFALPGTWLAYAGIGSGPAVADFYMASVLQPPAGWSAPAPLPCPPPNWPACCGGAP